MPSGLRPLSRRERKQLWREQQAAEFPDIRIQRLLATCNALDPPRAAVASLRSAKQPPPPQTVAPDA